MASFISKIIIMLLCFNMVIIVFLAHLLLRRTTLYNTYFFSIYLGHFYQWWFIEIKYEIYEINNNSRKKYLKGFG